MNPTELPFHLSGTTWAMSTHNVHCGWGGITNQSCTAKPTLSLALFFHQLWEWLSYFAADSPETLLRGFRKHSKYFPLQVAPSSLLQQSLWRLVTFLKGLSLSISNFINNASFHFSIADLNKCLNAALMCEVWDESCSEQIQCDSLLILCLSLMPPFCIADHK